MKTRWRSKSVAFFVLTNLDSHLNAENVLLILTLEILADNEQQVSIPEYVSINCKCIECFVRPLEQVHVLQKSFALRKTDNNKSTCTHPSCKAKGEVTRCPSQGSIQEHGSPAKELRQGWLNKCSGILYSFLLLHQISTNWGKSSYMFVASLNNTIQFMFKITFQQHKNLRNFTAKQQHMQ